MKALKIMVVSFILMTGFLISSGSSNADASDYLGEFCWDPVIDGEPKGVLKLGATHMGGAYLILQGKSEAPGEYGPFFFGSAQVIGNQIMISFHSTHSDSPGPMRDTMSCQSVLDTTNLNGTIWCIRTEYLNPPDDKFFKDYLEGTLTYVPCP